ncbi:MAG: adenylate/guanylate cyclase domain-containing protein, partial [Tateyamaria sp.]|nr:adenylate/guanylate cyclase domain-containing protein [Tateyamaria sp.]
KHTENACRAALACLQAEDNINNNGSSPLLPLHTRIGLHTGQVIVGNVGSLSRMQYTALGAVVNLASRIENLNKLYGTQILVSEDVVSQVPDIFLFSELDIVSPAGTSKPIKIFELLGNASETSEFFPNSEKLREAKNWALCYALYRARSWNKALVALEAHRGTASNRIVVDTFIARCRTFIATPPSINWDGVYNMKIK